MTIAPGLRGRGNSRHVAAITEPLLLVVGEQDRTTPASMSTHPLRRLAAFHSRKLLAVVPGAGHHDAMRGPVAAEAYRRFLDTALGTRRRAR
jgi:pimeloyl-ACP methyl ester carboxylesterase